MATKSADRPSCSSAEEDEQWSRGARPQRVEAWCHGWHVFPPVPARAPTARRYGYSLLEMMIVLGVASTVAVISWPMLSRPLNRSRVQGAAQDLCQEIADARLDAIESGQTYVFRYQPSTDRYTLSAIADDALALPAGSGDFGDGGFAGLSDDRPPAPAGSESFSDPDALMRLPDEVVFMDARREQEAPIIERFDDGAATPEPVSTGEFAADESFDDDGVDPFDQRDEAGWSAPVIFEPDGRSSNHRLTLVSSDGYSVAITLRGLTGKARIGQVRRVETPP